MAGVELVMNPKPRDTVITLRIQDKAFDLPTVSLGRSTVSLPQSGNHVAQQYCVIGAFEPVLRSYCIEVVLTS